MNFFLNAVDKINQETERDTISDINFTVTGSTSEVKAEIIANLKHLEQNAPVKVVYLEVNKSNRNYVFDELVEKQTRLDYENDLEQNFTDRDDYTVTVKVERIK